MEAPSTERENDGESKRKSGGTGRLEDQGYPDKALSESGGQAPPGFSVENLARSVISTDRAGLQELAATSDKNRFLVLPFTPASGVDGSTFVKVGLWSMTFTTASAPLTMSQYPEADVVGIPGTFDATGTLLLVADSEIVTQKLNVKIVE